MFGIRTQNDILFVVALLVVALVIKTSPASFKLLIRSLQWLYRRRIPLIVGAVLLLGPLAASLNRSIRTFTVAFYDVEPAGAFFSVLSAAVCAWSVLLVRWLIDQYGASRWDHADPLPAPRTDVSRREYAAGVLLTLPAAAWILYLPTESKAGERFWGDAIGVVCGYLAAAILVWLISRLSRSDTQPDGKSIWGKLNASFHRAESGVLTFLRSLDNAEGYVDRDAPDQLGRGHGFALRATALMALLYLILYFPRLLSTSANIPTLTYLMLLLTVVNLFLEFSGIFSGPASDSSGDPNSGLDTGAEFVQHRRSLLRNPTDRFNGAHYTAASYPQGHSGCRCSQWRWDPGSRMDGESISRLGRSDLRHIYRRAGRSKQRFRRKRRRHVRAGGVWKAGSVQEITGSTGVGRGIQLERCCVGSGISGPLALFLPVLAQWLPGPRKSARSVLGGASRRSSYAQSVAAGSAISKTARADPQRHHRRQWSGLSVVDRRCGSGGGGSRSSRKRSGWCHGGRPACCRCGPGAAARSWG